MAEGKLNLAVDSTEVDPAEAGKAAYWARLEEQHYQEELARYNSIGSIVERLGVGVRVLPDEDHPSPRGSDDDDPEGA